MVAAEGEVGNWRRRRSDCLVAELDQVRTGIDAVASAADSAEYRDRRTGLEARSVARCCTAQAAIAAVEEPGIAFEDKREIVRKPAPLGEGPEQCSSPADCTSHGDRHVASQSKVLFGSHSASTVAAAVEETALGAKKSTPQPKEMRRIEPSSGILQERDEVDVLAYLDKLRAAADSAWHALEADIQHYSGRKAVRQTLKNDHDQNDHCFVSTLVHTEQEILVEKRLEFAAVPGWPEEATRCIPPIEEPDLDARTVGRLAARSESVTTSSRWMRMSPPGGEKMKPMLKAWSASKAQKIRSPRECSSPY